MARVTHVKSAQQRYETVPVIDPATGKQKVTPVMRNGVQRTTRKGDPIFMRVTVADKTKPLPNLTCEKCGVEIKPGMAYKHVTPKSGPFGGHQRNRCAACPTWKESELSSSKMAGVYAAQEQCDEGIDSCEDIGDLETLRDDLAQQVREVGDEYVESAENMESGFGTATSVSDELRDKGEQLQSWADDIESVEFDEFEEPDADDIWSEVENENGDAPEVEDDDDTLLVIWREEHQDEYDAKVDALREEWIDEQRTKLTDELQNCPV